MYRLLIYDVVNSYKLDEYIKYGIRTTTSKVTEGLSGYPTGEWPMKKINGTYYDMSGFCKQKSKLTAKIRTFS